MLEKRVWSLGQEGSHKLIAFMKPWRGEAETSTFQNKQNCAQYARCGRTMEPHKCVLTCSSLYRKNREPADLRAMMLERVASLKDKCTDPHVTQREMKAIIEREFDDMHHLAREEERRALHLLDLQDAVASAHMSEVLAEIKGVVEMAKIIKQLNVLSEPALLKPENQEQDPRNGRPPPDPPQPGSNHRCFRDPPSANGPW
uniref:Tripartite motif-containing protein 44 isoform X3 n=1 Tax=Geotrypetes seraphini TaxID=260995 RepID=A0A6P8QBK1_GEOSA|nr:tripartite motif-containing protein 44 isoform X3 [Geotrypetes seraphini]